MSIPFVADRLSVADARKLIAQFGDDAGFKAAERAEASRDIGNVSSFCRWRQIERLVSMLAQVETPGTLH